LLSKVTSASFFPFLSLPLCHRGDVGLFFPLLGLGPIPSSVCSPFLQVGSDKERLGQASLFLPRVSVLSLFFFFSAGYAVPWTVHRFSLFFPLSGKEFALSFPSPRRGITVLFLLFICNHCAHVLLFLFSVRNTKDNRPFFPFKCALPLFSLQRRDVTLPPLPPPPLF